MVNRKRLRTQTCGALMLVVMVKDVTVPTLTVCGLSLRKLVTLNGVKGRTKVDEEKSSEVTG